MYGAPQFSTKGLSAADCLPVSARCSDGSGGITASSEPGYQALLIRAIQRAVAESEKKTRLAFYPRRKTNFARTAKEVYENRVKYGSGGLDSFLTPSAREYPAWGDLDAEQQGFYNNDQSLYTTGSLPWDALSTEQQKTFSRNVLYVPNKTEGEERIDGKGRSYIKFYERNIIKIHKLALEIQDPQGLGIPYLNRTYSDSEYFTYFKEGGVILFPAQAKISATGPSNLFSSAGYGLIVPVMPQIITVDYEYGLTEIPYDLQDAVALLAACYAFEAINIAFTKGMMSFNVSGFSASFGQGLYSTVLERYKERAEELLAPYYQLVITGY